MSSNSTFNSLVTAEMAADPRGDFFITMATSLITNDTGPCGWGSANNWVYAICTLAAFFLNNAPGTAAQQTGAVGPLTNRTTGKESISWGLLQTKSMAVQDAILAADPYGAMYLFIRNTRAGMGPLVAQTAEAFPPVQLAGSWWGAGPGGGWW